MDNSVGFKIVKRSIKRGSTKSEAVGKLGHAVINGHDRILLVHNKKMGQFSASGLDRIAGDKHIKKIYAVA